LKGELASELEDFLYRKRLFEAGRSSHRDSFKVHRKGKHTHNSKCIDRVLKTTLARCIFLT
jgi:hypothetical protein